MAHYMHDGRHAAHAPPLFVMLLAVGSTAVLMATGCSEGEDGAAAGAEDDLTSGVAAGTYVVDARPFGSLYASRLTFSAGRHFEAEIMSSSGVTSLLAGTYDVLPARPNNPQSPVKSDKPTLMLRSDSGAPAPSFEFDALPGGGLRLHYSARQVSFTMKKDPSWRPQPTSTKVLTCTGNKRQGPRVSLACALSAPCS